MRHFDLWVLRKPYDIWHFYKSGRRWQEEVSQMIRDRAACAPEEPEERNPVPFVGALTAGGNGLCHSSSQVDCMFLQKLPLEIRLEIYRHLFGDGAVHLVHIEDRIRHVRCGQEQVSLDQHRHCCPLTPARWRVYRGRLEGHSDYLMYPHTHKLLPDYLSSSNLEMLRTCRQIYSEAVDILYGRLAFDVDDLHTWLYFSRRICSDRLRRIKSLTVQFTMFWEPMTESVHSSSVYSHTHSDDIWADFWATVANDMPGLEELKLSLDFSSGVSRTIRFSLDSAWVAPILNLRGLKAFDFVALSNYELRGAGDGAVETLRDQMRVIVCSSPHEIPRGHILHAEPIDSKFLTAQVYEIDLDDDLEAEKEALATGKPRSPSIQNPIPGLLQRMESMRLKRQKVDRRPIQLALTAG